jgi:hypothetical protein
MKRLIAIVLAILITVPVTSFACGMTSGHSGHSGSGGGGRQGGGRDKWTKKRIKELKQLRQQDKNRGTSAGDVLSKGISRGQQLNNPLAVTMEDQRREARKQQQLKHAIEILALKVERGEATPEQRAKLAQLINYWRTNYTRH